VLQALSASGFPPTNLSPEQVIEPTRIIQMGVEPVQIHIMSAISSVTWNEAWTGHETARCVFASASLPLITFRALFGRAC
jgi:hypothetical protein